MPYTYISAIALRDSQGGRSLFFSPADALISAESDNKYAFWRESSTYWPRIAKRSLPSGSALMLQMSWFFHSEDLHLVMEIPVWV
jgi:hypothetical protein